MAEAAPVDVFVSPDGLTAVLRAPKGRDRSLVSPELCDTMLRQSGVRHQHVDWVAVQAFVEDCRSAPSDQQVEREVARGKPPVHGEQGRVEILEKYVAPPVVEADDGSTDYKARMRFVSVVAGERIGRVIDPTAGEEGLGVRGEPVAAKPGRPPAIRIHETIERRGSDLFARRNGALEVRDSVRIIESVEIPGHVDYSTGNVELPCDVVVKKCVRDDFVVDVSGSAEVHGLVEGATIRTGRDAALHGGMAARAKGGLHVGRDLTARYLDQVIGRVQRDARVQREIVNCDLVIGRALLAPTGQVIGGRVSVGGPCEIDTVGSEAGIQTELVVARSPEVEEILARAYDLKDRVDSRRAKVDLEYTQLRTLSGPRLMASQAERSTELEYELASLNASLSSIDRACQGLLGVVRSHVVPRLQVNGRVFAGATIRIGAYCARFRRDLRGPVAISFNDRGVPIVTNLLDNSVMRLKEVAPLEHDANAVTVFPTAA